jgi:two-component system response regulator (stage 0 sporulation protein F)
MLIRIDFRSYFELVETFVIDRRESPSKKSFPRRYSRRNSFRNSFGLAGMAFARIDHWPMMNATDRQNRVKLIGNRFSAGIASVGKTEHQMKPLKVLVVEDDQNLSFVLQQRLESKGYETRTAKDASEGFSLYLRFRPDLVISDLQLPGENGVELLRRIRKVSDPNVRTIYMSAHLDWFRSEMEQEKDRPEVTVLAKPFSSCDLMCLISAQ